jgi:Ca-activated chloride channel family protein
MKRLHRSFKLLIFSPLLLLLLFGGLNITITAQQAESTAEQMAAARRDEDSLVMNVTVTNDKGDYIDGLDKTAFALFDNKVRQEITAFAGGDEPASIGIIFDLSGSMIHGKALALARSAVLRFIELSHGDNDYFVVAFTTRPLVLFDWTRGSKNAIEKLDRYYFSDRNTKNISLSTALYDAVYLGVEKVRGGAHAKQVLLLISDGQDNESRYSFTEVRKRLKETGALLYSIGVLGGDQPGSSLGLEGQAILDEFSAVSGGKAYFPQKNKEIAGFFERIAAELRHQYVIGFKPSKEKADGRWHQLKIKVTPLLTATGKKQNLYARSREGYYALKNLQ